MYSGSKIMGKMGLNGVKMGLKENGVGKWSKSEMRGSDSQGIVVRDLWPI